MPKHHSDKNFSLPQLPATAGVGLRAQHYQDFIEKKPNIDWLEVHPENYFGGGAHRYFLKKISENFPISFHCVGLSLGSAHPVSIEHLTKIKELADIFNPICISDHASWSASGNAHLNDLLPLPYTEESLKSLCNNINKTQDFLGRRILLENPSTYLMYKKNELSEAEFLALASHHTGCGLLLDVNNIYVQSQNHGIDIVDYMNKIPFKNVKEIHLAGHTEKNADGQKILLDTHSTKVKDDVWNLYENIIQRTGPCATLIEWDQDLPEIDTLLSEAMIANTLIKKMEQIGVENVTC